VFVDHGLMRKNEGEQVISAFRDHFKVPLVAVDAEGALPRRAAGVLRARGQAQGDRRGVHPRLRGGGAALEAPLPRARGTLYSDVIESAAARRGDDQVPPQRRRLPEDLEFELVEPLRALFKDEVRAVGASSACPERLVWRQPFPGPGPRDPDRRRRGDQGALDTLRDADASSRTRSARPGLYRELWQSFCVLPDIRTVGVQGDERTYGYSSRSAR
jgi:GMP synthase (glutamine-hydrolysing)